jgi:hypothetical protein|tara:strand:+ start:1128 stop:1493 length:366 start_codon:yes stop_codon:yes gene_type:complete
MIELKRDLVKYIRDRAKSKYKKGTECYICGEMSNLDFHHFYSLSPLLYKWVKTHKKKPEDVLDFRDEFIQEHSAELYEHTTTLCHAHHLKLHSIYGKDPSLATAKKQKNWVEIQRNKHGLV